MFPSVKSAAAHSFDRAAWSSENGLVCPEPSRTIQAHEEDANINNIVKNFGLTGKLPIAARLPEYGDFDGISDYREAIHAIRDAEANFMRLPSKLRDELQNDPQKFLEFATDPANLERLREYGLAPPAPPTPSPDGKSE